MAPTIGMLLLTRNGGRLACRAISSVASAVDALVVVDTGSTDDTVEFLQQTFRVQAVVKYTPELHPERFQLDVAESFRDARGSCQVPGPFTGQPFLADFGAARNAGWDLLGTDYKFYLDTDDEWLPEKNGESGGQMVREAVAAMAQGDVEVGMVPYDYRRDDAGEPVAVQLTNRIGHAGTRWRGRMHERLVGTGRRADLTGFGRVVDRHDHIDPGSRVDHRGLKVLYHDYVAGDRQLETLHSLAREARAVMPLLSVELSLRVARATDWPEMRAASYHDAGAVHENTFRDYRQAWEMYQLARACESPAPEPYFSLARLAAIEGQHDLCEAYTRRGLELAAESRSTVLQHNPLARNAWPKYVLASSLAQAGRVVEARELAAEVLRAHPRVEKFQELASELTAG